MSQTFLCVSQQFPDLRSEEVVFLRNMLLHHASLLSFENFSLDYPKELIGDFSEPYLAPKGFELSFLCPRWPRVVKSKAKEKSKGKKGNGKPSDCCAVCGSSASFRCSGCLRVRYCSSAHQTEDWPTHKKSCKKLKK